MSYAFGVILIFADRWSVFICAVHHFCFVCSLLPTLFSANARSTSQKQQKSPILLGFGQVGFARGLSPYFPRGRSSKDGLIERPYLTYRVVINRKLERFTLGRRPHGLGEDCHRQRRGHETLRKRIRYRYGPLLCHPLPCGFPFRSRDVAFSCDLCLVTQWAILPLSTPSTRFRLRRILRRLLSVQ
ncbi:unnamed protein product, partial [Nesidiocoris tenuis]